MYLTSKVGATISTVNSFPVATVLFAMPSSLTESLLLPARSVAFTEII